MTDSEPNLQQILAALQQATNSITQLNAKIEKQNETIESLREAKPVIKSEPLTEAAEVLQMKEQLAKMTDQNNKFHSEQKAIKQANALRQGLLDRGIDPRRIEHAMAYYSPKVRTDKTGAIKMVDTSGVETELDAGLDRHLETEDAQFYKAPVNVQGGGIQPMPGQTVNRGALQPQQFGYKSAKTADIMDPNDFNRWVAAALGVG